MALQGKPTMEEMFLKLKRLELECQRAIADDDNVLVKEIDARLNRLWEELLSRESSNQRDSKRMVSFLLEQISPETEPNNLAARCKEKILKELYLETMAEQHQQPCKSHRMPASDAASR